MKKFIPGTSILLAVITIICSIFFIRTKIILVEINKIQSLIQKNQITTENIISSLNIELNAKLKELSDGANMHSKNLGIVIGETESSNDKKIEEVKSLIVAYTEEVKNENAVAHLFVVNKAVENDISISQLLAEGLLKYTKEDFTAAIKVFKKVLNLDFSNREAQCFYNASLYYQNPGDRSTFPGIKYELVPILEEKTLTINEKSAALKVLIGISMEEGNTASLKKYQETLQQLEESR